MDSTENIQLVLHHLGQAWQRLDPEEIKARIEEIHGMRIVFQEVPLADDLFGMCLIVANDEQIPTGYVYTRFDLTPTHRLHVRIHELAHLALGHRTMIGSAAKMQELKAHPERLVELGYAFACRATRAQDAPPDIQAEEQEAELLTRVLFEKHFVARRQAHLQRSSSQASLEEALRHMGITE